ARSTSGRCRASSGCACSKPARPRSAAPPSAAMAGTWPSAAPITASTCGTSNAASRWWPPAIRRRPPPASPSAPTASAWSRTAAAGTSGMDVWIWNVEHAEPVLLIPDALDGCVVHALAFHPQGRLLAVGGVDWMATGGSDGAISFWDIHERCEVATFGGGTTALAFRAAGDRLASATLDRTVILWDAQTQDPL